MRILLLTLSVLAWAISGLAAETFTIPFSVVPGSVIVNVSDGQFLSTIPFSQPFSEAGGACTGTFSAEIVNDGLEVELDVVAVGSTCSVNANLDLEIEFDVPELGGTATMVRVVGTPLTTNFPVIQSVSTDLLGTALGSTSSIPGAFDTKFVGVSWDWRQGDEEYPTSPTRAQSLKAFIPGDTVRVPLNVTLTTNDDSSYVATIRMRYEFLVTVPEPSAALGLPIGAAWLVAPAAMKGG